MSKVASWIAPDWPVPPNVKALITTRHGGVSSGAFSSLNLGLLAGDDPHSVAENRARLRRLLPQAPQWLRQVHGTRVVDADDLNETTEADAAIARRPGTVCAVMIADCLPVLLSDRAGSVVAVAHAGWRGLSSGVVENTVAAMRRAGASEMLAYLGPAIGPQAFEVGADVRDAFLRRDPDAAQAFAPHGGEKWLADLFMLARQALARAGVTAVHGGGLCTYSDPARFFSYRRDKTTGRMAALIWRES
jgi:YfiH family protein